MEIDFREPEIWISKSLIQRWEPPFQSVLITEQEKEEILKGLKSILEDIENKKIFVHLIKGMYDED